MYEVPLAVRWVIPRNSRRICEGSTNVDEAFGVCLVDVDASEVAAGLCQTCAGAQIYVCVLHWNGLGLYFGSDQAVRKTRRRILRWTHDRQAIRIAHGYCLKVISANAHVGGRHRASSSKQHGEQANDVISHYSVDILHAGTTTVVDRMVCKYAASDLSGSTQRAPVSSRPAEHGYHPVQSVRNLVFGLCIADTCHTLVAEIDRVGNAARRSHSQAR